MFIITLKNGHVVLASSVLPISTSEAQEKARKSKTEPEVSSYQVTLLTNDLIQPGSVVSIAKSDVAKLEQVETRLHFAANRD